MQASGEANCRLVDGAATAGSVAQIVPDGPTHGPAQANACVLEASPPSRQRVPSRGHGPFAQNCRRTRTLCKCSTGLTFRDARTIMEWEGMQGHAVLHAGAAVALASGALIVFAVT